MHGRAYSIAAEHRKESLSETCDPSRESVLGYWVIKESGLLKEALLSQGKRGRCKTISVGRRVMWPF
jgi:hypothetical protein